MAATKGTRKRTPAAETKKEASSICEETTGKRAPKKKRRRKPPLTPTEKVRKSQQEVLRSMPEIVTGVCNEAKGGNHNAAKFVFDFARITELQTPLEEPPSQDSLAGILLDKLQVDDPPKPPSDTGSSTVE